MCNRVEALVRHFEEIYREHMQGIPIINPRLSVEAVGFTNFDGDSVGVLITPWFMNLVLLPGTDEFHERDQGAEAEFAFPAGRYAFTIAHDDQIGTFLTAVLFRSVTEFADQEMARDVAETVLEMLFEAPQPAASSGRKLSRRELFAQLGAG